MATPPTLSPKPAPTRPDTPAASTRDPPAAPVDGDLLRPPRGRTLWITLIVGVGLAALAVPFDPAISRAAVNVQQNAMPGELKREMRTLEQYGQLFVSLLGAWIVWLMDRRGRRALPGWAAAAALTMLACQLGKIIVGRPRPRLDAPFELYGVFRPHVFPHRIDGEQVEITRYSWEIFSPGVHELWSAPSSHAAMAAVMSTWLAMRYPKLAPTVIVLAAVVALRRVLVEAHYLSDVLLGATLGLVITAWAAPSFNRLLERRRLTREAAAAPKPAT